MSETTVAFPRGFLWGTATSAYLVEGGISADWSEWETEWSRIEPDEGRFVPSEFEHYGRVLDTSRSVGDSARWHAAEACV